MPSWIIKETIRKRQIKKVLIIGVAYKKDLDDTREAPSIEFIKILRKKKIKIDYHDPNVKYLKSRKLNKTYVSKNLNSQMLKKYDCVIIITDHSKLNYELIKKHSRFIVDTRNIFSKKLAKVLKL